MAPKIIKEQAYFTLVRPQIEYAVSAWAPWLYEDINKLEKLQQREAQFVTGSYHQAISVSSIVHNLRWDSLETRRVMIRLQLLYKIIKKIVAITIPNTYYLY